MKILILNGPNLNMLGLREPHIYGNQTYADLEAKIHAFCAQNQIEYRMMQTNHEGVLVDEIQAAWGQYDGIVINPAAYTHTSIALLDALKAVGLPAVEVHISDVTQREDFRQRSFVRAACLHTVCGKGLDGYCEAIAFLQHYLQEK